MPDPDGLNAEIDRIVGQALAEDLGTQANSTRDITTHAVITGDAVAEAAFVARETLVLAGIETARRVFSYLSDSIVFRIVAKDGEQTKSGESLATVSGPARAILTGERTALNLLQHLSGVATLTARYAAAIAGTKAVLRDTRKTLPGLRRLEKYAVRLGGGTNHRMGLHDAVLIKDNHIAVAGGVAAAVTRARNAGHRDIQVECDSLKDIEEALGAGAPRLLLDNMPPETLRRAVVLAGGRAELEASGGVTLETIGAISETGVDFISVGRLTQSAAAVDIGLDIHLNS